MSNYSDERGVASEAIVEQALETIRRNPRHDLIPRITGFVHAARHSELDRNHIDFLISFEDDRHIPLQVKSSLRHARRFEKRNKAHKHFIPVVVVKLGEALESVIHKLIGCIQYAFKKMQKAIEQEVHFARMHRKKKRWCTRFYAPSMCH